MGGEEYIEDYDDYDELADPKSDCNLCRISQFNNVSKSFSNLVTCSDCAVASFWKTQTGIGNGSTAKIHGYIIDCRE